MCEREILVSYKKMPINVREYFKNRLRLCSLLILITSRDVTIFGGHVLRFSIV